MSNTCTTAKAVIKSEKKHIKLFCDEMWLMCLYSSEMNTFNCEKWWLITIYETNNIFLISCLIKQKHVYIHGRLDKQ